VSDKDDPGCGDQLSGAEKEEEFNRWYNEVHIPEVMKVPGWTRASRFVNMEPSEKYARYLTIWELEEDAWRNFREHVKKQKAGEIPDFTWDRSSK